MRSRWRWAAWALGVLVALVLTVFWSSQITNQRIDGDDLDTLRMAVNLRYHGVASLDEEPPFAASMYREPVPVVATALSIAVADALFGRGTPQSYLAGDRARLLKLQNVVWLGLLCLAAFWATYLLTRSRVLGFLAALLMNFDIVPLAETGLRPLLLDTIMSELPSAALLLAATALLVAAVRSSRGALFLASGACFGLLALTKAAFFYVFIGLVAASLLLALIGHRRAKRSAIVAWTAALTVAYAAVVLPWMARNYFRVGDFQVAERGGVVLYVRALKNDMTADEYRGAYYFWAPQPLQPLLGGLLGFSAQDLRRGGRLERLNRLPNAEFYREDIAAWRAAKPEEAITFIRKALGEQLRLERLEAQGALPEPADTLLQRRAMDMIGDNPARHVATTPLFLWRGAFFPFPVLLVAFLYAVRRRDLELGAFVLPALGSVAFFALLTHFLPRYSVPMMPIAVVATIVLCTAAVGALVRGGLRGRRGEADRAVPLAHDVRASF